MRPEGFPCAVDASSPACAAVVGSWEDPFWRAAQPGAMQRPFWEADRTTGANCYTPGEACAQGDVPPYAVAAESTADVAAALAFAAARNVRSVVKSSGHDIQGRSTAPGALLVWTAHIKNATVHEAFTACPGDAPLAAIAAAPGDSYGSLYDLLDPSRTLVGGSARTVSAAGGHALGGGHSFLSPHHGLAVDNMLAATAVLSNGTALRASACENADLFWALRGGGGGSFAVVTEVVHRLHATPSTGVAGVVFEVALLQGEASVQLWLDGALALSPALTDSTMNAGAGVFGGYHNTFPAEGHPGVFVWEGIFGFNGTQGDARASLAGFRTLLASQPAHFYLVNETFSQFASWEQWHASFDPPAQGDRTGTSSTIGCRFFPQNAATSPALRANASAALAAVANYVPLLGHLVVGGAVAQFDRNSQLTSVTPAWRDAMWHMCIGAGWDTMANITEQNQIIAGVSQLTEVWRVAVPGTGAYWNEADFLEPEWEESFWGAANYARLQRIKAAYDPSGLLSCWHCVELPSAAA